MKTIFWSFCLFICSFSCFSAVNHFDLVECRSFFFGKRSEGDIQVALNDKIQAKVDKLQVKRIDTIRYGNQETWLRNKENACIIATVWYET